MKHVCYKCGAENTPGYAIKSGGYRRKDGTIYKSTTWKCKECSREETQKRRYKLMPLSELHRTAARLERLRALVYSVLAERKVKL